MTSKTKTCSTCNRALVGDYIEFKCPNCNGTTIRRCEHCREHAGEYSCECGFIGP